MLSKKFKYIICIFVILIVFASIFSIIPKLTAEPLSDELDKIKSQKEETQKKIEDVKKEESVYIKEVNEIEDSLLSSLDGLNKLNSALADKKSSMDKITVDLAIKEEQIKKIELELNDKLEIFNRRIKVIYMHQDRNILEVLLKSGGFIEFVSRIKMMSLFAKQDAEAISEIKNNKNLLLASQKEVLDLKNKEEKEKTEIKKLVTQAETKKRELEGIYDKKKEILSAARANKEALVLMENQLQIKELEITKMLAGYSYGIAPTGKFLWPVNGKFSSGFGYRGKRFHAGVDLYAPNGTPIYACESGQVIKAEYHGGYGYCILIYHGGGLATFYAHLSGFAVSLGQNVSRGQIIGYVGTTGYTTGPHLHLEVRSNGAAQNPMNYL